MKSLLFLICICIVISCHSRFELEGKLYECAKKNLASKDIDPDQLIVDFETYLIQKKFLNGTSPDNYLQLIDSLTQPIPFSISIPKELENPLFISFSVPGINNYCEKSNFDSIEIKTSRIFEWQNEVGKVFQKMRDTGELDQGKLTKDLMHVFKGNDFQHPIYKLYFYNLLTMYISNSKQDQGVLTALPPWSENEPDITKLKERNVFNVYVNSKNKILVRNKLMKLKDLKMSAKEFINNPNQKSDLAEYPYKAIISLKNDRGTSYKTYLDVFNELKAAYNELRNEKAMELHNLPYEKLEKPQQKEIRNMIPLIISEAEPTAFGEEG
ncbi:MAG: ExbD/TolR family protein [Saprospiraceae bacterium]